MYKNLFITTARQLLVFLAVCAIVLLAGLIWFRCVQLYRQYQATVLKEEVEKLLHEQGINLDPHTSTGEGIPWKIDPQISLTLNYSITAPPGVDLEKVLNTCKIDGGFYSSRIGGLSPQTDEAQEVLEILREEVPLDHEAVIGITWKGNFFMGGNVLQEDGSEHVYVWQCASIEEIEVHLDMHKKSKPDVEVRRLYDDSN